MIRGMQRRVIVAACLLAACGAARGGQRAALSASEPWQMLFAGQEVQLGFVIRSADAFRGRFGWCLTANSRVIRRGERPVTTRAGKPVTVHIKLALPAVKDAVVMPILLECALYGPPGDAVLDRLSKRLFLCSKEPFVEQKEWLRGLRILLYDPEKQTARTLDKAGIPHERVMTSEALDGVGDRLVVVGTGVDFRRHPGLFGRLCRTAARGGRVLVLAPAAGALIIPGLSESDLPVPQRIGLRHRDVISELDKRLDADAWPPDGLVVSRRLVLKTSADGLVGAVAKKGQGWPWLDLRYAHGGRLVICGFALVEKWDAGPAPRFLLARLLKELEPTPADGRGQADQTALQRKGVGR